MNNYNILITDRYLKDKTRDSYLMSIKGDISIELVSSLITRFNDDEIFHGKIYEATTDFALPLEIGFLVERYLGLTPVKQTSRISRKRMVPNDRVFDLYDHKFNGKPAAMIENQIIRTIGSFERTEYFSCRMRNLITTKTRLSHGVHSLIDSCINL